MHLYANKWNKIIDKTCSIYVNIGDKNLKQFCEQKKLWLHVTVEKYY